MVSIVGPVINNLLATMHWRPYFLTSASFLAILEETPLKRRTVGFIAVLTLAILTPLAAGPQTPATVSCTSILAAGAVAATAYAG